MINNIMNNYTPYCYLIGWSSLNKWYYGSEYSRKGKVANPLNLWTKYFTSSKHVERFRSKHGDPDVILIRKIFKTAEETVNWEHRVLRKMSVKNNSIWLNASEGKAPINAPMSKEKREEKSKSMMGANNPMFGKTHSVETRTKISAKSARPGKLNGMFGKTHTKETKTKMVENRLYTRGVDNPLFGIAKPDDLKDKWSKSHKPTIHIFFNFKFGFIISTKRQLIKKFPELLYSGIKSICSPSGRWKKYKGWIVIHTD